MDTAGKRHQEGPLRGGTTCLFQSQYSRLNSSKHAHPGPLDTAGEQDTGDPSTQGREAGPKDHSTRSALGREPGKQGHGRPGTQVLSVGRGWRAWVQSRRSINRVWPHKLLFLAPCSPSPSQAGPPKAPPYPSACSQHPWLQPGPVAVRCVPGPGSLPSLSAASSSATDWPPGPLPPMSQGHSAPQHNSAAGLLTPRAHSSGGCGLRGLRNPSEGPACTCC